MLRGVRADGLPHAPRRASPGKGALRLSSPPRKPYPPTLNSPRDNPHPGLTLPGAFQPNETWVNSVVDNCTEYHCQAENGVPVLTLRPVPCPDIPSCRVRAPGIPPAWLSSSLAGEGPPTPRPGGHTLSRPRDPAHTPPRRPRPLPVGDAPSNRTNPAHAPPSQARQKGPPLGPRPAPSPLFVPRCRAPSGKPAAATPVRKWVSRDHLPVPALHLRPVSAHWLLPEPQEPALSGRSGGN